MAHKEEEMRQLVERMQRLKDAQERQARERRWEPIRATRNYMHYGIQEEDWRVHNFEECPIAKLNSHHFRRSLKSHYCKKEEAPK